MDNKMATFLLLSLPFLTSAVYKIGSFKETIVNPDFPDHEIPMNIFYPSNADDGVTFPIIIFAHGFECDAQWYNWIPKDMVPLGYIVAMINPFSFPGSLNATQFAIDQRYTLKWLVSDADNNQSLPVYHRVDPTKSLAAGHSEGGGSSMTGNGNNAINDLFDDKFNFNAIFTMAPCGQDGTVQSAKNVSIPTMIFAGTMDCICPQQEQHRLFENLPDSICKYYADITNGTHCRWLSEPIFSDICADAETDICKELHPNNNITISSEEQLSIGSRYMQMFLNATLIDGNNKAGFEMISKELNSDEVNGQMSKTMSQRARRSKKINNVSQDAEMFDDEYNNYNATRNNAKPNTPKSPVDDGNAADESESFEESTDASTEDDQNTKKVEYSSYSDTDDEDSLYEAQWKKANDDDVCCLKIVVLICLFFTTIAVAMIIGITNQPVHTDELNNQMEINNFNDTKTRRMPIFQPIIPNA